MAGPGNLLLLGKVICPTPPFLQRHWLRVTPQCRYLCHVEGGAFFRYRSTGLGRVIDEAHFSVLPVSMPCTTLGGRAPMYQDLWRPDACSWFQSPHSGRAKYLEVAHQEFEIAFDRAVFAVFLGIRPFLLARTFWQWRHSFQYEVERSDSRSDQEDVRFLEGLRDKQ